VVLRLIRLGGAGERRRRLIDRVSLRELALLDQDDLLIDDREQPLDLRPPDGFVRVELRRILIRAGR